MKIGTYVRRVGSATRSDVVEIVNRSARKYTIRAIGRHSVLISTFRSIRGGETCDVPDRHIMDVTDDVDV